MWKTLGIVAVITLLVWIFAEGESLSTTPSAVRLLLRGEESGVVVTLAESEASDLSAELTLEGPTARLDELRTALRRAEVIELTTRELGDDSGTVRLADALRRHPLFEDSGVSVAEAEPRSISIEVDRLVERRFGIVVDTGGVPLRGLAEADPASVTLMAPSRIARDLPDDPVLIARLDDDMLRSLTPGQAQTLYNIPTELPAALAPLGRWLAEPPSVNVSLTPAASSATSTISAVPVFVSVPAIVADRYIVRIAEQEQLLTGVQLRGPSEALERVGPGKPYPPRIDVALAPEDLSTRVPQDGSEVELALPGRLAGVPSGVELAGEPPVVRVFVSRPEGEEDASAEPTG